jgi:hypothetical protein
MTIQLGRYSPGSVTAGVNSFACAGTFKELEWDLYKLMGIKEKIRKPEAPTTA